MQTDILEITKHLLVNFSLENQVVETVCSLYSNLTFKNEENKAKIGEKGIIEVLHDSFKVYSL